MVTVNRVNMMLVVLFCASVNELKSVSHLVIGRQTFPLMWTCVLVTIYDGALVVVDVNIVRILLLLLFFLGFFCASVVFVPVNVANSLMLHIVYYVRHLWRYIPTVSPEDNQNQIHNTFLINLPTFLCVLIFSNTYIVTLLC